MRLAAAVLFAAAAIAAAPRAAHADEDWNYLVGPVLGVRLGGPSEGGRGIFGLEGGAGIGPERVNVGLTRRLDQTFGYIELDPWYIIGGSLGFGAEFESGKVFPVVGVWEGVPIKYPECKGSGLFPAVTLAGGYRWTGVHELYLTVKAGRAPSFCID